MNPIEAPAKQTKMRAGNNEWWNINDVADFLGIKPASARHWMWKMKVKRSAANYRLTHRSWVEQALDKKAKKVVRGTANVPQVGSSLPDDSSHNTNQGEPNEPTQP